MVIPNDSVKYRRKSRVSKKSVYVLEGHEKKAQSVTTAIFLFGVVLLLLSGNYLVKFESSSLVSLWTTKAVAKMYSQDSTLGSVSVDEISKVEESTGEVGEEEIGDSDALAQFAELINVNPDTRGWIKIPNTQVDNVIVHREEEGIETADDYYYLNRGFTGKYSQYGTLFFGVDNFVEPDFCSQNLTIHGHHMRNGQMFGDLKKYRDFAFYKENPVFTMDTICSTGKYKIFSIFITNSLHEHDSGYVFPYATPNFDTREDFIDHVINLKTRSLYSIPIDVSPEDSLVTLSTCDYDFPHARLIIVARKIRDGESDMVNIEDVKLNESIVYPQIWYDKFGGSKPKTVTSLEMY